MSPISLEQLVEKAVKAIDRRRAVLFLGAGASMEGQGPSGKELTEALKDDYSDVTFATNEFLDGNRSHPGMIFGEK